MEEEPGNYLKLAIKQHSARTSRETPEGRYWKRYQKPSIAQQFGAVTHIHFCDIQPYDFAVTSSTRVIVYGGPSCQVKRTISRFKDKAYSGQFRNDGKLLVAGGQDGVVQVFDANSRGVLRQLKAHKRPAHVARFSADKVHVLSGSDDVTVRWWDVTEGVQLCRMDGHTDYVRAGAANPASLDVWATGGYDHTCRLWDVRSGKCTMTMTHDAPVEALVFLPSGSLVATASGNAVYMWDLLAGGRRLQRVEVFAKAVTSLCLSAAPPRGGSHADPVPRLLAGSMSGDVKVFDLDALRVTAASRYPDAVTALAVSPDRSLLVVGTASGLLSVRKHKHITRSAAAAAPLPGAGAFGVGRRPRVRQLTAANYRYFIRGQSARAARDDYVLTRQKRVHLPLYDKLLRKFRYGEALDAALLTRRSDVVSSLLEELSVRGGLTGALSGRDTAGLVPLLAHMARHITDPRHARVLASVAHRVLDIYAPVVGSSPGVDAKLVQMHELLVQELRLHDELALMQGIIEPILGTALSHQ